MTVWVFPGQGSQRPHMGDGFAEIPELLGRGREALDVDLSAACLTGTDPEADPTLVQPALFVVGVAAANALRRLGLSPDGVIGHSFGEYAALFAAGALSFETGLRLTAGRARAMAGCADGRTGMLAVLGLSEDEVRSVCAELEEAGGVIEVSNVNSPRQLVLAGEEAVLVEAGRRCLARGAFRIRRLRVPYAAHTRLMEPAAAVMGELLDAADIRRPAAPLYSCVTGEATTDPGRIRELLREGMTRPVNFPLAVRAAAATGHTGYTELGPGRPPRLLGLIRATLPDIAQRLSSVSDDAEAATPLPFQEGRVASHAR